MQTRVPGHIRQEVRRILEEKAQENDYLSESDYLRELIVKDLKAKGRL
jgi:Arc/MetJ-type ribon-helix-helix transcriptional regulator